MATTIINNIRLHAAAWEQDRYFRRCGEKRLSDDFELEKGSKVVWNEGEQGEVYLAYNDTGAGFFGPNLQGLTGWYVQGTGLCLEQDGELAASFPIGRAAWKDLTDGGEANPIRHSHS